MSWMEVVWLVVLAIVMFGPEKIPELSRKLARVVWFLRGIANNAQTQLREELGPEFENFDVRDLRPKEFIRKHILEGFQGDLDDIKSDIDDIRHDLGTTAAQAETMTKEVRQEMQAVSGRTDEQIAIRTPFDPEAT